MYPFNKPWLMLAVIHPAGQPDDLVHACIPARIQGLTNDKELAASRLKIQGLVRKQSARSHRRGARRMIANQDFKGYAE